MVQSAAQLYLLKDLSRLSGHSIHTLKFYLKLGVIQEVARSPETRFRYFDDATVERLATIRAWRRQEKSLAEIQRLLDQQDGAGLAQGGTGSAATVTPHDRSASRASGA